MCCFTISTSERWRELKATPTELGSLHLLGFFPKFVESNPVHFGWAFPTGGVDGNVNNNIDNRPLSIH